MHYASKTFILSSFTQYNTNKINSNSLPYSECCHLLSVCLNEWMLSDNKTCLIRDYKNGNLNKCNNFSCYCTYQITSHQLTMHKIVPKKLKKLNYIWKRLIKPVLKQITPGVWLLFLAPFETESTTLWSVQGF